MIRRDSWNLKHDSTLAEIVIGHIKNGSTQLKAFEEAANELNRSESACGFRWNSVIRKQHKEEIKRAKEIRLQSRSKHTSKRVDKMVSTGISTNSETSPIDLIIQSLVALKDQFHDMKITIQNLQNRNNEIQNNVASENNPSDDLNKLMEILQRSDMILNKEKPTG